MAKEFEYIIESELIDTDLSDFVTTLSIGSLIGTDDFEDEVIFDELTTDWNKLIVTDLLGNSLYCELEYWDDSNEKAVLHIKIPDVYSDANTVVNINYDSANADQSSYIGIIGSTPGQTVWGGEFIAHYSQDPSGGAPQMLDSSSNGEDGTTYGSMATGDLVDMVVGKGLEFDGSTQYVSHPYNAVHDITDLLTLVVVFRPSILMDSSLVSNEPLLYRGANSYSLEINTDGKLQLTTTAGTMQSTTASFASGSEYLVVATYNSTGLVGSMFIYDLDTGEGGEETLSVDALATMSGNTNALLVGNDTANFFTGAVGFIGVYNEVKVESEI